MCTITLNKRKKCCSPDSSASTSPYPMILLMLVGILGFVVSGCGEDSSSASPNGTFSSEPIQLPHLYCTTSRYKPWEQDVFCPSEDFRQYCADTDKAFSKEVRQGTYVDENNWLRSWNHETYLWYNEIEDENPRCCTTQEYFQLMKTKETTSSGKPKDRFHFSRPTAEYLESSREGVSVGYGVKLLIINPMVPRDIRVAYTEPSSPATSSEINLVRGSRILAVDGIDIVNSRGSNDIKDINRALFQPEVGDTHIFTVQDPGSSQERLIIMTAEKITSHPVQNVKIMTDPKGDRIGYMLFNSHSISAAKPLIEAGKTFLEKGEGVDDLIIDLRYNGGGILFISQLLSSMIAGSSKEGQTFLEIRGNDKQKSRFFPFNFEFEINGETLSVPSLNLKRLFVLTGPSTCSASEGIINGLRGVDIDIIQIGSTTCGKPYGFVPGENCGTTYFSINFKDVNAKGTADYADGFSPDCHIPNDDLSHNLGDPEETYLKTALDYIRNGTCPSSEAYETQQAAASIDSQKQSSDIGPALTIPSADLPGKIVDPTLR